MKVTLCSQAYATFRSKPLTRPEANATANQSSSWVPSMPSMPSMPGLGRKKKEKLPLRVAMAGLEDNPPRG